MPFMLILTEGPPWTVLGRDTPVELEIADMGGWVEAGACVAVPLALKLDSDMMNSLM